MEIKSQILHEDKDKNQDWIKFGARIKVVGVGGSGGNAIDHMINSGVAGVDFIVVNSDTQDLHNTKVHKKIHIGKNLTHGLGTGMDPEIGRQAAEETKDEIQEALQGADLVCLACGLGGGTGTGAAPIIGRVAKNQGALSLAVVTKPFSFEGPQRAKIAEQGLKNLIEAVDAVIVISNDRLLEIANKKILFTKAFALCDDVLKNAIQSLSELIVMPGIINLDFADVKTIIAKAGFAIMGIGRARGKNRAIAAVTKAINSPLLDTLIDGAKGVLLAVAGGKDLGLLEINEAARIITTAVDSQAKIIFGAFYDESLDKGEVKITIIAAGLPHQESKMAIWSRTKNFAQAPKKQDINKFEQDDSGDNFDEDHLFRTPAFIRKKVKIEQIYSPPLSKIKFFAREL